MKKVGEIKIGLVDDEFLIIQGVKMLIESDPRIEVVMEATDGFEMLELLENAKNIPDIIITDLNMPNLNGVELTKSLVAKYPQIKIIALTSYFSKAFVVNMISEGAVAYLNKSSNPKLMIETILGVYENGFYYTQEVLKFIQGGLLTKGKATVKSKFDRDFLTKRELEILGLICEEYSSAEIAEKLFISKRTVEGHRNNILVKTGVKNIAGLVIFALKNKLIDLKLSLD